MNELAIYQDSQAMTPVDPSAIAAGEAAKARIQSAYIMAIRHPRNQDQARDRILHACKRPAFAERVEFSKPVGGRAIKGPSIRLAELALREWGNILSDVQVIYEDQTIRRSRIMVVDLETNTSFSKEINIAKTVERKSRVDREVVAERVNTNGEKVFIVRATDDEIHNKEAAAISKALRNEGLRVIPQDIIDEAMDTARDTLKNRDKADPDAAKKKLLDSFSEIGVKPKDLQVYLKHSTDQLNPSELQDLRSIYRAIKDGEARWSDYVQPSDTEELTKTKAAQLKDKLKSATGKSAQEPMSDPCPNNGDSFKESYCAGCPTRTGCPAWGTP
jgi:precorrin isomerase